jgi:hypothetical protein
MIAKLFFKKLLLTHLAVTVSPYGPPPPTTSEVSMSRYSLPAQRPGLTVTVGWDNPVCRESVK